MSKTSDESNNSIKNELYNFKQVKAAIVVFLNFIKNNPQLRDMYDTDYNSFISEVITNPLLNDIIINILSQTAQISESMEKGENIKVNINGDNGEVEKIELSKEDEKNIDDIIKMGFNADDVCKIYAEYSLHKKNDDTKTLNSDAKKELTLQKLFGLTPQL